MASMPKFSNFVKPVPSPSPEPSPTPSEVATMPKRDIKDHEAERKRRDKKDRKDSSPTRRDKHKSKDKRKKHKKDHTYNDESDLITKYDLTSGHTAPMKSLDDFETSLGGSSLFSIRRTGDRRSWRHGGISKLDLPDYDISFKGAIGAPSPSYYTSASKADRQHDSSSNAPQGTKPRAFEGRYCAKGAVFKGSLPIRKKTPQELQMEAEQYGSSTIPVDITSEHTENEAMALFAEQQAMEMKYMERNRELNALLLNDPKDISNWLKMVHAQDEFSTLVSGSYRKQNKGTGGESLKVVVETKLEIFRRALEHNPRNVTLVVGMLETMQALENPTETSKAWHTAVSENPDSGPLWLAYLSFIQSNFSSFSMERIRTVCTSAVRYLNRAKSKVGLELEEFIADVLVRTILIEHKAGYIERAFGIYQALIEINFAAPETLRQQFASLDALQGSEDAQHKFASTRNALLTSFQAFWEAPIPKFGEEGAQGWNTAYLQHDSLKPSIILYDPLSMSRDDSDADYNLLDLSRASQIDGNLANLMSGNEDLEEDSAMDVDQEIGPPQVTSIGHQLHQWIKAERQGDQNSILPLRVDQAGDEIDAVVLFEDIKDLLVFFSSNHSRMLILESFLDLLGLFLPKNVSTNSRLYQVKDMEEEDPENIFDYLDSACFPKMASVASVRGEMLDKMADHHIVFPRFYDFLELRISPKLRNSSAYTAIARRVLTQTSQLNLDAKTVNQLKMALILLDGTEVAKQLLQVEPDNIFLWNAFLASLIPTDANAKALQFARRSMNKTIQSFLHHPHVTHTLRLASIMEIEAGDYEKAKTVLLSISGTPSAPAASSQTTQTGAQVSQALRDYDTKIESFRQGMSALVGSLSSSPSSLALSELQDSMEVYFNLSICSATFLGLVSGVKSMLIRYEDVEAHLNRIGLDFPYLGTTVSFYIERLRMYQLRHLCMEYQRMNQQTPIKLVQRHLKCFLEKFPSNRYALSVLTIISQHSNLIASSRVYFDSELFGFKKDAQHHNQSRLLQWIFATRSEVRIGAIGRIRHILERSLRKERLEDAHIHQSVLIWKIQLDLAFRAKIHPGAAKGLLYRAIRSCPWSKSLWLYFLDRLSPYLRPADIGDLLALIAEKEIRLRSVPDL